MKNLFCSYTFAILMGGFALGPAYASDATAPGEATHPAKAHPDLSEHMKRFAEPKLVRMSERVWMAQGYDYANFAFIEGDTSIIVIDCGWFTGPAKRALADFRKISQKPIGHIFYTHGHGDHVGGVAAFTKDGSIPIYAHKDYERYRDELVSSRLPFILRRGVDQMGPLLKDNVGTGIGIMRFDGEATYFRPNVLLGGGEKLTIDGVRIEIMDAPSDLDDEFAVWVPDERVLMVGDAVGGVGPYVSTPRNEQGRDPYAFVSTLDRMMDYPAEAIVAGHGAAILGRENVQRTLKNNRDIIQFMIDSVVRTINSHTQREVALAELVLPTHLANDPDLGWFYHSKEMVWRGIYSRLAGWYGDDPIELLEVAPRRKAKWLVDLAGGPNSALEKARLALRKNDPELAATLASHVLRLDDRNAAARSLLAEALTDVAYSSPSTSQRNYLRTEALLLTGKLDRSTQRPLVAVGALLGAVDSKRLLEAMTPRIDAGLSAKTDESWVVRFAGETQHSTVTIRLGVATVRPLAGHPLPPTQAIALDRSVMIKILLGQSSFAKELANGTIQTARHEAATAFFGQFDPIK